MAHYVSVVVGSTDFHSTAPWPMVDINFYDAVYNVMLPLANLVQFVVIAEICFDCIEDCFVLFVYEEKRNAIMLIFITVKIIKAVLSHCHRRRLTKIWMKEIARVNEPCRLFKHSFILLVLMPR